MNKKILFIIGGGGFFFQSLCILKQLEREFDCFVAIPSDSNNLRKTLTENHPNLKAILTIPAVTTISLQGHRLSIACAYMNAFYSSYHILKKIRPTSVIVVASSIAMPVFIMAKLMNIKTIFIESITRVHQLSTTGKLILNLNLANRFYIQWPELAKQQPKAIYKGTVL